jgi:AAA ATPase domain/AAA domain, putative AbiEii toxin, Type IV TA system
MLRNTNHCAATDGLRVMLESLKITNYKCFENQTIPFRPRTIVVGRNNAGKSTIAEAVNLVSLVANRAEHLSFKSPPAWAGSRFHRGVQPALDDLEINFEGVFHRYGNPPSTILAKFSNGSSVELFIGLERGKGRVHGVIRNAKGKIARSAREAALASIPTIAILPQVGPVDKTETILSPQHVQRNLSTSLAPKHFRNQINLLYRYYREFRAISEETWPGLRINAFIGRGGERGDPLQLLVQNEDFVAEVSWMGHGLQMWLQTMWFLARSRTAKVVMLDEPDVYMHSDLQRRLIRFLRAKFNQTIITTHAVEMLAEVDPTEILIVDRRRAQSGFADTLPAMQRAIDGLGTTHNIQLSRLWGAKKLILVEGDDMQMLTRFYDLLFPDSLESLGSTPHVSIGGWGGWSYAVGSSMLLQNAGGEEISVYCILDSDYHTPQEIEVRQKSAEAKNVRLHVWQRKEIENYLLVPDAIRRVIAHGCSEPPSASEITLKLQEIASSNKNETYDSFAESFYSQDKGKGQKNANVRTRAHLDPAWRDGQESVNRVSGKMLLSSLSDWSKAQFGVSFGVAAILRALKRQDLAAEVVSVISAIEANEPFPRVR